MALYLGIDTSNYTTSVALYDSTTNQIMQKRKLLNVKSGEKGLRQSDALFQHVKQLPFLFDELFVKPQKLSAVGFSARPRDVEGSYMPCFLAGEEAAICISKVNGIECFDFSHQAGHIVAALYSINKLDFLKQRFLAFHVSGGTTDVIIYQPKNIGNNLKELEYEIIPYAQSLDLKAGQAVDRVGIMLGLDFPAGPKLEQLALKSTMKFNIKPCMKGNDCCLSGLENKCQQLLKENYKNEDIAKYCIEFIKVTLDEMAQRALKELGNLPLVFAGGVMSNSIIRDFITNKYGAYFAKPEFSSDNASGIATLTKIKVEGI